MSILNLVSGIKFEEAADAAQDTVGLGKKILEAAKTAAKNPVVIGTVAVAAVGTAGYYGYKKFKNRKTK